MIPVFYFTVLYYGGAFVGIRAWLGVVAAVLPVLAEVGGMIWELDACA